MYTYIYIVHICICKVCMKIFSYTYVCLFCMYTITQYILYTSSNRMYIHISMFNVRICMYTYKSM